MPMLSIATVLESIVLDNDRRVLPCHLVMSGLSLLTRTFISAVKMRDEKAPAPWVVADGNTIGSSVSDEMKKCDLLQSTTPTLVRYGVGLVVCP